jgi:flagellar protein FlaG
MTIESNNVAVRDFLVAPQTIESPPLVAADAGVAGLKSAEAESVPPAGKQEQPQSDESSEPSRSAAGLSNQRLLELAQETAQQFQALGRELEFEVAENSGRTIITVLDRESGDVIRSIPPEKLVEVSEYLSELSQTVGSPAEQSLKGLLLNEKTSA